MRARGYSRRIYEDRSRGAGLTVVWLLLVSVRDGRGRATAIDGSHAWMLEQHEPVVQLGQRPRFPPITRSRGSSSAPDSNSEEVLS